MRLLVLTLISFAYLTTAARVYTGFNYGAFWSYPENVKKYADFQKGFSLAKNLTNVPVPFDSARLFTCITAGTKDDPTEAFQAAIDTGTNLLLGMWVSPGAKDQSNDIQVANELAALGKAFKQYGQKLADLVIGLSVGNEDIYRSTSDKEVGIGMDKTVSTIQSVRKQIADSEFAEYMEGKPIGHTDTAPYAVVEGSDFAGMNAYPYWTNTSIADAGSSFMGSLEDTRRRAGTMPVWITEMGWPIKGANNTNDTLAGVDNYQRYWTEVGCQVFGKYNTFWFELLQDSQPEQPDWGLLDTKTFQTRIGDLSCGGDVANSSVSESSQVFTATVSPSSPPMANIPAVPADSSGSAIYTAMVSPSNPPLQTTQAVTTRTTRVTRTVTVTAHRSMSLTPNGAAVQPPPAPLETTQPADDIPLVTPPPTLTSSAAVAPPSSAIAPPSSAPQYPPHTIADTATGTANSADTVCIVMMDLLGDGVFIPVATHASDVAACAPPPRFSGTPLTLLPEPASSVLPGESEAACEVSLV